MLVCNGITISIHVHVHDDDDDDVVGICVGLFIFHYLKLPFVVFSIEEMRG